MTTTPDVRTELGLPDGPEAALVVTADMSLGVAQSLLAGVQDEATRRGVRLAAVVVDRGGNVVATARMDHAQL
jgi:glc operon protein GlcG